MSSQRIPFSRNTTTSIFETCVTLLNEILQKVMLRFYTSFRIQSAASILSTAASIEALYAKNKCCIFLKECSTMLKERITLYNGTLQKSSATLHFFQIYYILVSRKFS